MSLPALQGADPEGQHTAEDTDSRAGCHIFREMYAGHDTDSCQHYTAQKENHAHRQPDAAPQSPDQKNRKYMPARKRLSLPVPRNQGKDIIDFVRTGTVYQLPDPAQSEEKESGKKQKGEKTPVQLYGQNDQEYRIQDETGQREDAVYEV